MNINFVIDSENPKDLSCFYAKINSDKAKKGFNSNHYFISLSSRSKIHFYRSNKNRDYQREGNITSLCFQGEPSKDPGQIIERWTSEILKIGGRVMGKSKLAKFGSEQWMLDPEGNQFLILVPYLSNGSDMDALM
ncbi:lactoylglutathione lyase [Prochlorococcus marinus]|nr:lactoylglutathione lyase [Prochlorococcus marinus]